MGSFAEDVEVLGPGNDVDGVCHGCDEVFEGDEEGDGEAGSEAFFHFCEVLVFEAAEVGRWFLDVFGFDHGDDDAAFFGGDFGGGVALGALVEVGVFRVAACGDDGDVGLGFHPYFLHTVDFTGTFEPCFVGVASNHGGDFPFCIDDGVDEEAWCDHVAGFLHVFGDGVSCDFEEGCVRVQAASDCGSQCVAVVLLDGFEAGYAREDEFPSAAKACHVVGGDGVDEDDFVSFDDAGVDPYVSASCRGADVGQHGFVGGDVLVHFNAGSDFLAHAGDVFLVGVDAVGALCEDDVDVVVRDAGVVQFVDDVDGEFGSAVPCAGDVSDDEADLVAFLHEVVERLSADRMTHAFDGGFFHVAGGRRYAFEDVRDMFFRQHDGLRAVAVGEFKFFQGHRSSSLLHYREIFFHYTPKRRRNNRIS